MPLVPLVGLFSSNINNSWSLILVMPLATLHTSIRSCLFLLSSSDCNFYRSVDVHVGSFVFFSRLWRRNTARPRHLVESQLPGVLQAEQGMRLEDHRADWVHRGAQVSIVRGTLDYRLTVKGKRPVKLSIELLAWLSVCSEVQIICIYS